MTGNRSQLPSFRQQHIKVDAGLDAHLMQHMDEVFGRDIPGGPWNERAAPDAAKRGIEVRDSRLQPHEGICQAHIARIVQVKTPRHLWKAPFHCADLLPDLEGAGRSTSVSQGDPAYLH